MIRSISTFAITFLTLVVFSTTQLSAADAEAKPLFNGKDTSGWKARNPKITDCWKVVSDVALDPADAKKLAGSAGEGVLFRAPVAHGTDIITEAEFGDCEVHVEFVVPKGSNSGVYLMGQYEVQVLDSYGRADNKLAAGDCGGIYSTKAPSTNASKAPGEWQSFDIIFRAPRFEAGKKTQNAKFISVKHNGTEIHKDVDVPKPTGGQLDGGEKPTGPLMFQGDHGIVAFRNVTVKALDLK
jgi:hypothetical protein